MLYDASSDGRVCVSVLLYLASGQLNLFEKWDIGRSSPFHFTVFLYQRHARSQTSTANFIPQLCSVETLQSNLKKPASSEKPPDQQEKLEHSENQDKAIPAASTLIQSDVRCMSRNHFTGSH